MFVACSAVPTGGLFRERGYVDVDLYGRYAEGLLDGRIPYRDVFVEYPPGAFVVLLPPALVTDDHYRFVFKCLMALVALGGLWCVARLLARLGVSSARLVLALGFLAVSPLLLGSVWLNSYDVWPAALGAAALLALVSGWTVAGFACLALAFAAKLYALALVGPALLYTAARQGRRAAVSGLGVFVAIALVPIVPFVAVGADGVWSSIRAQAERGLHVESLGASLLLAADRLGLYDAAVAAGTTEAKSRDLAGHLPDALAGLTSVLVAFAVAAVWMLFARGRRGDPERLVAAFAGAVAAVVAFTKILSPQYAEWLLFLVPLVAGAGGVAATALLAAALLLAELWFHRYRRLYAVDWLVWLVLARNLCLAALYAVLLKMTIPSRSKTTRHEASARSTSSAAAASAGAWRSR